MVDFYKIFGSSGKTLEQELLEEKKILLVRKHWFILVLPILFIFLFLIFLCFLYFFVKKINGFPMEIYWFFTIISILFLWIILFYNLMVYFLNYFIVTDKRVVLIETKGFFQYERKTAQLDKIQDLSAKVYGLFGTFLNFGDVEIETAGAEAKFVFSSLPNPQKIKEEIFNLINQKKESYS